MLTDKIQEKLRELLTLPDVISVGLGKKTIGNTQTDTIAIIFNVKVKHTNPENMLPTSIDIDGVTYVTDVIGVGEIAFAACPATPSSPISYESYVVSGMSFSCFFAYNSSSSAYNYYNGTFGFVAYHPEKNILVGVTAAHLLYDASQPSSNNKKAGVNSTFVNILASGYTQFNYPYIYSAIFVNGYGDPSKGVNSVAQLLYYEPLKVKPESDPDRFNQVDGCLTFVGTNFSSTCILPDIAGATTSLELNTYYDPSWRSYQVKGIPEITSPMPFATPAELNALITNPPSQVSSTGAGSGVKHGLECGLKIDAIGVTTSLTTSTIPGTVYFDDLLSFSRITPELPAIVSGDSGAALIAKIGGVWKIIGMVIGGNATTGYACRIDNIASQLGIEAWDGSVKPTGVFVTARGALPITPFAVTPGRNDSKQVIVNNKKYKQFGTTTLTSIGSYE